MLLERSDLTIKAGSEEAFAAAMASRGVPLLRAVPGVIHVSCGRGVEQPGSFMLLVGWESMEAHKAYNLTPESGELRQVIGAHAVGGAMQHFDMAD